MKAKIIIANWLISLAFLFTDSIIQAIVALCWFGLSCFLLEKYKQETKAEANKFNKWIDKQINKQSYK